MALSDIAIRKAKAADEPYRINDSEGLHLLVEPSGRKVWRVDYTLGEKRRRMRVGRYPSLSLAAARVKRDEVNELAAAGVDPVEVKRGKADVGRTFEAVARRWHKKQRGRYEEAYFDRILTRFVDYVFPFVGSMDIADIRPSDMLAVVRRLEARGVFETGRRINQHCSRIFKMAIVEGLTDRNPCADIVDGFAPQPRVEHLPSLSTDAMGGFMVKLRDGGALADTLDPMLLTIFTVARTDEIRFADVNEFVGLDGNEPNWMLAGDRMKKGLPHIVPLSRQAAEIIRRRIAMLAPGQTLLFRVPRTRNEVISENRMLDELYRLGYKGVATMHGFRSTFSTLANEAQIKDGNGIERRMWESDWIERELAHVERNKVRAAYNAAEYLQQRRGLMQWWADWIDRQEEMARLIG